MSSETVRNVDTTVRKASVADTARVFGTVMSPLVARGVIIRRPNVVKVAERVDADRRAVQVMQQMRDRYGPGPLLLRTPMRRMAVVLSPDHVHRVLRESPDTFAIANQEKRAALSHFQPHGLLISQGRERADRRRFNEQVLDAPTPVHHGADAFLPKIRDEAGVLLDRAARTGTLTWEEFLEGFWRLVRRIVLGDTARYDSDFTDLLRTLRQDANWSFAKPKRRQRRAEFLHRLREYVERAEPGSLAQLVATTPSTERTVPYQQIPQWLFAYDAAAMATFRALALIAAHDDHRKQVREELAGRDLSAPAELPSLRATVLESLRLWPTTPAVLRDTTTRTMWETGELPAGTAIVLFAPFFHRDDQRLPYAHRFAPEVWLDGSGPEDWPLIPFSGGPGECPGRNLVLFTASELLAALLAERDFQMQPPDRLDPRGPLPGTFSPFDLGFRPRPTSG